MSAREGTVAPDVAWRFAARGERQTWEIVLGFAMIIPAAVFLLSSYVEPTVWTIRASLAPLDMPLGWGGVPGGSSNYRAVLIEGFGQTLWFALSLLGLPLVAVLLVSPILALCVNRLGLRGRKLVLGCLTLPAVAFAPVAVAAAWRVDRHSNLVTSGAVAEVRTAYGMTSFGLICTFSVVLYLAALRQGGRSGQRGRSGVREPGGGRGAVRLALAGTPWKAVGLAGAFAVITAVAAALQAFTVPFVLTGGGPDHATTTPVIAMFSTGLQQLTFGPAAATSALLLALLALLGVLATVMIISAGVRIEVEDDDGGQADKHPDDQEGDRDARGDGYPDARRDGHPDTHRDDNLGLIGRWMPHDRAGRIAAGVTASLVAAVLGVAAYAFGPWIAALFAGEPAPPGRVSSIMVFAHTWLPSLVSTLIGVSAAAAAGHGIGAIRPLGTRSELLLLPFAPFLFVGIGPLALRAYAEGATATRFHTMFGLIPPTSLAIPALFVFTLLARGQAIAAQAARWHGISRSWTQTYLTPSLPMIGIVGAVTWVASAQDLLWPVLSGSDSLPTGPARLYDVLGSGGLRGATPVEVAMPGWVLLFMIIAAVVARTTYLDRVALRIGDTGESGA